MVCIPTGSNQYVCHLLFSDFVLFKYLISSVEKQLPLALILIKLNSEPHCDSVSI